MGNKTIVIKQHNQKKRSKKGTNKKNWDEDI